MALVQKTGQVRSFRCNHAVRPAPPLSLGVRTHQNGNDSAFRTSSSVYQIDHHSALGKANPSRPERDGRGSTAVCLKSIRPSLLETHHLVLEAKRVGVLQSRLGESVVINHPVGYRPQTLAEMGLIDCIVVDTEDGFSQLGMMRRFLSQDLGLNERNLVQHGLDGFPETLERNISSLADWNRFKNLEVTLIAIPSERQHSHLKGLILAPHDGSECYRQYAGWDYGTPRPHRDFIYNVTYEAIAHAYNKWGSKRVGITHFSRGKYHRDLTTCQVEAMAHFCSDHQGMESFTFLDDHEGNQPLEIVREFSELPNIGTHRPIVTKLVQFWGIDFVSLEWTKMP